ncbi:hypothetical protein [Chamaesiphon polymorphus]|uniref:Uncharacterized protein n=1 Tax=Chamaesiphon polymorphus CCALA 037 TaxID=2107692 RepID=A0A2T1GDJ8_9CYAN|nr:hypothetical protein [Chamaesiphon polymorphus]PSB55571.1 hypothetical protein C7B77_14555 [Chamaesiphon polymorphus CCALA 037]
MKIPLVRLELFDLHTYLSSIYKHRKYVSIAIAFWMVYGYELTSLSLDRAIDTSLDNYQQVNNSTPKIIGGKYASGGVGMSLIIRGNKYYYTDEIEQTPWKSISRLKSIQAGVVYGEGYYWCLSTLPSPQGVCTRHGWMRDTAAKDIKNCSNALTTIRNSIERVKNVRPLRTTSIIVANEYPHNPTNRPDGYELFMAGKGGYTVLKSQQLMRSISIKIIAQCPTVSIVSFIARPEVLVTYGLVNDRVREFKCYEAYNTRLSTNPKLPWGYQSCL